MELKLTSAVYHCAPKGFRTRLRENSRLSHMQMLLRPCGRKRIRYHPRSSRHIEVDGQFH